MRVLLLGATGGCGSQVLTRLLSRDVETTVIVRDEERLPEGAKANPLLRVIVEPRGHLALSNSDFADAIKTVDAVISCLGHTLTLSGVFGHPRRLCRDTKNFVTYTVLVAVGGGDAVAVRRRFSDFEKLYKSFVVRFGSTGMVVPSLFPRPEPTRRPPVTRLFA